MSAIEKVYMSEEPGLMIENAIAKTKQSREMPVLYS